MAVSDWRWVGLAGAVLLTGCGSKPESEAVPTEAAAVSEPVAVPEAPAVVAEAPRSLKERAESGDAEACQQYALEFEAAGDKKTAFEWFKQAAKSGHIEATYKVGTYYAAGIEGAPDLEKAKRCYLIASKADHPAARQAFLELVQKNEKTAVRERTLRDEEFEGMPMEKALPLIKEKALRELAEWKKTEAYTAMLAAEKKRLYEEFGVDGKFVTVTTYEPLSLLKKQVEKAQAEADVEGKVAAAFPESRKAEVEAAAAREYPGFVVGQQVTVKTRRGQVDGLLQAASDKELRISGTKILLDDVPDEERRKLDPVYIARMRGDYMAEAYTVPRAALAENLRADVEDSVMLDAGYLNYNGNWVPTNQLVERVIEPKLVAFAAETERQQASEMYRAILERNGMTIVRDKVITLAEKETLAAQHTAQLSAVEQEIALLLASARNADDFTKAINMANAGLSANFLATNKDMMMRSRDALIAGRDKLSGAVPRAQKPEASATAPPTGGKPQRKGGLRSNRPTGFQ